MTNLDAKYWAERARHEAEALLAALVPATDAQWSRSPVARPDGTGRRATGTHADPVADTVTDLGRLHVRDVLVRSESHLRQCVVTLTGVRRAVELALDAWEGIETESAPEIQPQNG